MHPAPALRLRNLHMNSRRRFQIPADIIRTWPHLAVNGAKRIPREVITTNYPATLPNAFDDGRPVARRIPAGEDVTPDPAPEQPAPEEESRESAHQERPIRKGKEDQITDNGTESRAENKPRNAHRYHLAPDSIASIVSRTD